MQLKLPLTTENILRRIEEEDIYKYYWNPEFELKTAYSSPFRSDNRPSFNVFKSTNGTNKLLWKDFGTGESGNCFKFVERLENTNYFGALYLVNKDFNLGLDYSNVLHKIERNTRDIDKELKKFLNGSTYKKNTDFKILTKPWRNKELSFWLKFRITEPMLRFYNIFPIHAFIINEGNLIYPGLGFCYSYKYNEEIYYKIYQPYSKCKWLCNTNANIIEGYEQLVVENKKHNILFITKSLKDCICLRMLGYGAVAPQSETTVITEEFINKINKYGNKLVILFDNDQTGITKAQNLSQITQIPHILLEGSKDISDYICTFGIDKAKEHVWQKVKNL